MKIKKKHIGNLIFWMALSASLWGLSTVVRVFAGGLYLLGLNQQVVWGVLITNFVFWIGLAHAGTFISAILLLLRQSWRKGIHRLAEATTLVAIIIALVMPVIHLGRPQLFYEILPNTHIKMNFQLVNFSSPLSWDFYAILTYLVLSVIFIFTGLIPDFAYLANKSNGLKQKVYRLLSFQWQGNVNQWTLLNKTTFILAALIAPLVISVHTIVSFDFAVGLNPGWHNTSFPLYFVTGAVFSGFALVQFSLILFENLTTTGIRISKQQVANMNKILLFCSVLLGSFYLSDIMNLLIPGNEVLKDRLSQFISNDGFLISVVLVVLVPQIFWINKVRTSKVFSLTVALLILIGMWLERYGIVIQNQQMSFWTGNPVHSILNLNDLSIVSGSLGIFILLLLGFSKILPLLPFYENEELKTGGKV